MAFVSNWNGYTILFALIDAINGQKQYLSEIDGQIGDGDHGINMSKGFTRAGERITEPSFSITDGFRTLGEVLLNEVGGSMGPLYGTFFLEMAQASSGQQTIDEHVFSGMLNSALIGIREMGQAEVGDKTLMDTLVPATAAFDSAIAEEQDLGSALGAMKSAAERGRDSTKDLVARKGRASRLGERSRGVLDAGATSCCLILSTLADTMHRLIEGDNHGSEVWS